jgi:N-methylhydantoinase A
MNSEILRPTSIPALRIGIDIGGTFTDFVIFDPTSGKISTFKLPSTPHDPSEAVLRGLGQLGIVKSLDSQINHSPSFLIHGSTVATNALLERKGVTTALITTRGFKDVIQIGRQNRPKLYDFAAAPVKPLVPRNLRFEIDERISPTGEILIGLEATQINEVVADLRQQQTANDSYPSKVESVAVCFLFSFANPQHEQIVSEELRAAGYFVSASYEILPEYREYERTSTTVVNAYVSPVLDRYLKHLEENLPANMPLQIMQSNGGSISVTEARKAGVRCILSGPAGGVVGCQYVGELAQNSLSSSNLRLLTFDMGGTSTDVSLIDGQPQISSEAEVGGLPIRIPLLDIHTIGAGGGSIAYVDAGGALRVGPESAGADPGPACYGRVGDGKPKVEETSLRSPVILPTVTDANLLLGRIPPDRFLGGEMILHPDLAEAALAPLAQKLGLSIPQTALGIIEIANAHMERALRVISVERGYDPREFTLLSFGGAGSLHAADLARRLRIPQVLIPPYAATLSAFGMLAADVVKDYTQTVMLPGETAYAEIQAAISKLLDRATKEIRAEGFDAENIRLETALDMRYRGQSYELSVPFSVNWAEDFHEVHRQTYGYQRSEAQLEIVNLRVRATGVVQPPKIAAQPLGGADPSAALIEHRGVILEFNQKLAIPFYHGEELRPGNRFHGPVVVVRDDTTILIPATDSARVDQFNNLIIHIGG